MSRLYEQFTVGGHWLVTRWVSDRLTRQHRGPFFLACGLYRPHEPWFVPRAYFDRFPLAEIQLPPGYREDDLDDLPPEGKRRGPNRYFAHIRKHGQWRRAIQGYLASIAFADAMLGRVLDAVEQGPHAERTVVVLWSDHGWQLGEKQYWQKFTAWRAVTRVPLMIRVPRGVAPGLMQGTPAGSVCAQLVNLLDLFPTLTDLARLPPKPDNDGHSLVPLLSDSAASWPHGSITYLAARGGHSVSRKNWRSIRYPGGDEELYHIAADPFEWTNLAAKPVHEAKLRELRRLAPHVLAEKPLSKDTALLKGKTGHGTSAID